MVSTPSLFTWIGRIRKEIKCEDLHLGKFICDEAGLAAHVPIAPGGSLHLHPGLVHLLPDVVAEDVPDVLLALQLLAPHLQQLQLRALAGKVEEVVVLSHKSCLPDCSCKITFSSPKAGESDFPQRPLGNSSQ